MASRAPEPGELIYLPQPSWYPPLLAAGIAGVVVSIFTWWPYGVVAAVVGLLALWGWIRDAREQVGRLPRRQRTTTAPLPPLPLGASGTEARSRTGARH